jgi:hypothetical protein
VEVEGEPQLDMPMHVKQPRRERVRDARSTQPLLLGQTVRDSARVGVDVENGAG